MAKTNNENRRFVISDIHGCLNTFIKLLESIELSSKDTLYLLGDYINKGPNSKGVLDYIVSLIDKGYDIRALRGNHEDMLIHAFDTHSNDNWQEIEYKLITLQSFNVNSPLDIPSHYIDFLRTLPYYFELEKFFLVHAGFDFSLDNIFSDTFAMTHIKNFEIDLAKTKGKKVIHGHLPQKMESIYSYINNNEDIIKLDAGCVYYKNDQLGKLLACNLDTMEIILQENIDYPYQIGLKKNI